MLTYLSTYVLFIWIAIIASQLLLASFMLSRRIHAQYPWFCVFMYFASVKSVFLLVIASTMPAIAYFRCYYATDLAETILALASTCEIYAKVFGPRIALPGWVQRNLALLLSGAVMSILACTLAFKATVGGITTRSLVTVEQIMSSMVCCALWIIVLYAYSLRLYWDPRTAGITIGFVLWMTVDVIGVFIRASSKPAAAETVRRVALTSYFLSLLWWGWRLLKAEPAPEKATAGVVGALLSIHEGNKRDAKGWGIV